MNTNEIRWTNCFITALSMIGLLVIGVIANSL